MENNNAKLIESLRALCDFLEKHPKMPSLGADYVFYAFVRGDDNPAARLVLADAARMMSPCKKVADGEYFELKRDFGYGTLLVVLRERKLVCERIKTGEKVIPAKPEEVLPEKVIPAQPERVEEVWTWKCPESLLSESNETPTIVKELIEQS